MAATTHAKSSGLSDVVLTGTDTYISFDIQSLIDVIRSNQVGQKEGFLILTQ